MGSTQERREEGTGRLQQRSVAGLGMRLGHWGCRNRRRGDDLQLAYLLP